MRFIRRAVLSLAAVCLTAPAAAPAAAQNAPIFDQVPAVLYETFRGLNNPTFGEYFEMLVEKYSGTTGYPWAIYVENAKTAYRISILPDGLNSLAPMQQARSESFQEFDDSQRELWLGGWGQRQAAVYGSAPALSVVPDDFTVDDIRALPYNRVTVYYLRWDKAAQFRQALAERSALDRDANIPGFVLTAWNGGVGTPAQVVMLRVSAESQQADIGANREARQAARASYREEFNRLSRLMNDAAYRIERHDQRRADALSYSGN